jgi:hypothetical protein
MITTPSKSMNHASEGMSTQRLETLAIFAALAAGKIGQDEVAKTLVNLRQSAPPGKPEANGSAPTARERLLSCDAGGLPPRPEQGGTCGAAQRTYLESDPARAITKRIRPSSEQP